MPIGLGIGRLVFGALNKVEWFFALVIFSSLFLTKIKLLKLQNTYYFIPLVLLLLQTVWVLPALDARAALYIQQLPVSTSYLHFYFVGMEFIKVALLALFGFTLFRKL